MTDRLNETAGWGPRKAGGGTPPRPSPAASSPSAAVARQLVRALRSRLDEVSTAGRPGGETMVAVRVVLAEVEVSPLAFIAAQQRAAGAEVATRDLSADEEAKLVILRMVQRRMRR